jgi:hypothetical protein
MLQRNNRATRALEPESPMFPAVLVTLVLAFVALLATRLTVAKLATANGAALDVIEIPAAGHRHQAELSPSDPTWTAFARAM